MKNIRKPIAVVGAGIYGITIASYLSDVFDVHVFEMNSDILMAASWVNQFRLHRGYHYPRSDCTIRSTLASEPLFRREYPEAIRSDVKPYYCISGKNSLVGPDLYLKVLDKHGLAYRVVCPDLVNPDSVDLCIEADETLIDPDILYRLCREKITRNNIRLHLDTAFTPDMMKDYFHVIVATYATINELLPKSDRFEYQHEICEKPLVSLPHEFAGKGIVIMDGPFMCVDSYGTTGNFLMGNVVHALHSTNVGELPEIPKTLQPYMNNRLIRNPAVTKFPLFIESAKEFIPGIVKAKHIGSFYTVRTVLPGKDATDERPMIVRRIDDNLTTVFSGKISNCVEAAIEIRSFLIPDRPKLAARNGTADAV